MQWFRHRLDVETIRVNITYEVVSASSRLDVETFRVNITYEVVSASSRLDVETFRVNIRDCRKLYQPEITLHHLMIIIHIYCLLASNITKGVRINFPASNNLALQHCLKVTSYIPFHQNNIPGKHLSIILIKLPAMIPQSLHK
jgi:hypothetical protein